MTPFSGGAVLSPWTGFAVFTAEVAVLMLAGWLVFRHRDA